MRKQYYEYLLEEFQDINYVNPNNLATQFTYMAFEGKWEEPLSGRRLWNRYAAVS